MEDNFLTGLVYILLILFGAMIILLPISDSMTQPYNVTETVEHKDISHIGRWEDITDYNIYTTNYHFSVSLTDYNNISVGDNLTVEIDDSWHELCYGDSKYLAEYD